MRRPDTAPTCYAFFFGLVLISLAEPWKRIESRSYLHYAIAAAGCAAAAIFVGLPHSGAEPAKWMLVLGGAGAIAVMLLPGVSGSLFLVIIGQYATVAGAVHDRDIGTLLVFMAGMGIGVVSFVPFLRLLLDRYHDLTMAALTGLMAGSLRALWPWKSGYDPKEAPMINQGIGDDILLPLVAFVAGGAVVWLLAQLEHRILGENGD
jgi:putative membrane protein